MVTLAPHAAELVAAAGGSHALAGVIRGTDHPTVAHQLPQVGDAWHIDRERLVQLKPDLIVAWLPDAVAPLRPLLEQLSIPVFVSAPTRAMQIPDQIEALGKLLGTETEARRQASRWRADWQALVDSTPSSPAVTVFLEVGRHPLYTLNRDDIANDVVQACGGKNVFADLPVVAPQVSLEAVLAAQPDIIVAAAAPGGDTAAAVRQFWQPLAPVLPAARDPVLIDPDTLFRPGPRLIEGAQQVCAALRGWHAANRTGPG